MFYSSFFIIDPEISKIYFKYDAVGVFFPTAGSRRDAVGGFFSRLEAVKTEAVGRGWCFFPTVGSRGDGSRQEVLMRQLGSTITIKNKSSN